MYNEQDILKQFGRNVKAERVRQGYLKIAQNEPNRVKVINSVDSIENIHKQVVQLFVELNEKLAK